MTITNDQILTLIKGISELEELDLPLNIKLSYNLAKNRQTLNQYFTLIGQKQLEIYAKYGEKVGRTEYKIPEENIDMAQKALNELGEIQNEINLTKININDFEDNKVPFYVLEKLLPIIEEINPRE